MIAIKPEAWVNRAVVCCLQMERKRTCVDFVCKRGSSFGCEVTGDLSVTISNYSVNSRRGNHEIVHPDRYSLSIVFLCDGSKGLCTLIVKLKAYYVLCVAVLVSCVAGGC